MRHDISEKRWNELVLQDPHLCDHHIDSKCRCKGKCTCHYVWCGFEDKPCAHKEWVFQYTTFTERGLESVLQCTSCGRHIVAQGYVVSNFSNSIVEKP